VDRARYFNPKVQCGLRRFDRGVRLRFGEKFRLDQRCGQAVTTARRRRCERSGRWRFARARNLLRRALDFPANFGGTGRDDCLRLEIARVLLGRASAGRTLIHCLRYSRALRGIVGSSLSALEAGWRRRLNVGLKPTFANLSSLHLGPRRSGIAAVPAKHRFRGLAEGRLKTGLRLCSSGRLLGGLGSLWKVLRIFEGVLIH
jgi:hypothetical protein